MRASLATREDRGIAEEDNWTDIKQHVELLQIFIEHELNKSKVVCSTSRDAVERKSAFKSNNRSK